MEARVAGGVPELDVGVGVGEFEGEEGQTLVGLRVAVCGLVDELGEE